MEQYTRIIDKYKWQIALIIPLVVVFLSISLKNISYEGNYRIWFQEGSDTLVEYDSFKAAFGNDDFLIITFKDENGIFNHKALETISRLTEKLWQTKYISRVDSLTNYPYISSDKENPDEVIVEEFILDPHALSNGELERKKGLPLMIRRSSDR